MIPVLVSFYGFDVTERIQNRAVRRKYIRQLKRENVFSLAVSNSLVNNINKLLFPFNEAILLPSGIDTSFYRRKGVQNADRPFTFLQVSSFTAKKGHLYTIRAFAEFVKRNPDRLFRFIIAGFGPLEQEIRNLVKDLSLENLVDVRKPVSPAEMVELAGESDCFVHMSVTAPNGDQEGLPNVILEAMSLELPILSTYHAGIPDVIENGVHGILCPEKDIEAYMLGFERISTWEKRPGNREKIEKYYGLGSHMRGLNWIYNKIVKVER